MGDQIGRPGGNGMAAAKPEPAVAERRRHERYEAGETVTVSFAGLRKDCIMSDISLGGAMLEGYLPVEDGTELLLSFAQFDNLPARAVYVGEGFCGVQFLNPAEYRGAIGKWIQGRGLGAAR